MRLRHPAPDTGDTVAGHSSPIHRRCAGALRQAWMAIRPARWRRSPGSPTRTRQSIPLVRRLAVLGLLAVGVLSGCRTDVYYFGDDELSYYKHAATDIAYPDVETVSPTTVTSALAPRTVRAPGNAEHWDLGLQEAIRLTLENSQVMRDLGGRVLANPTNAPTIYDPAITESDPRFGVEGALSAFDAQFTTSILWSRVDQPLNNALIAGGIPVPGALFILQQDTAAFRAQISKTTATGGQFRVTHNVNYDFRNVTSNVFPSVYTGNLEFGFTQPLLQGAGAEFNRIAGPNATPGFFFSNGVIIARINNDISIADFETSLRNLVSDVENAYWDLYFAYRDFDAQSTARDSALRTWRTVNSKYVVGGVGGAKSDEAQARQQLFMFESQQIEAWNTLLERENQLRLLMGVTPTDDRLIRPADEPTTAIFVPDWHVSLAEALTQRVELRRQKWVIKRREMELRATKNFLLPRLDVTGLYRVNGLGDRLIADDTTPAFDNFYGELLDDNFQDWQIGLQLTVPIGQRQAHAAVRSAQLNLTRERRLLAAQEDQVTFDLTRAIQDVDRFYTLMEKNFSRRLAAEDEVDAFEAAYETGRVTLDRLLDAQQRRAQADRDYYNAVTQYNKALKQVQLAKGTLLPYNHIALAEGPWHAEAYRDAAEHARERMRAIPVRAGFTEPEPFALPQPKEGSDPESLTHGDELDFNLKPDDEGDKPNSADMSPTTSSPSGTDEQDDSTSASTNRPQLDLRAVEKANTLPPLLDSGPTPAAE